MATVEVQGSPTREGWHFIVSVTEGRTQSRHEVSLDRAAYERLAGGAVSPEVLVRESFAFLLAHEPKESILRAFDLPIIGRYFPQFEAELQRRLPPR
jgi:hypothetical protein